MSTTAFVLIALYLIGSLITLCVLGSRGDCEYEWVIFATVFYPVIIAMWMLIVIVAFCATVVYGLCDLIGKLKVRKKNDN